MKKKVAILSLIVFMVAAVNVAMTMSRFERTYDGSDTSVAALYEDPTAYDVSEVSGVADAIVKTDLDKTHAQNVVTAVVFDYRGYDTMGESFILLTAISGSMAILRKVKKGKEVEIREERN